MGDINIDNLVASAKKSKLTEFLSMYDIQRLDLPPTRITPNSQTSIDLVCSNNLNNIVVGVMHTGISDHTAQMCEVNLHMTKVINNGVERRALNNTNLRALKELLGQQTWESVYQADDVNSKYNNLDRIINQAINQTCPLVNSKVKKIGKINIQDEETRLVKNVFLQAQERYLLTGNLIDKLDASKKKKAYDLKLREKRKIRTANIIEEADNKCKVIWNIINSEREVKPKSNFPNCLSIDNVIVKNPKLIANHLNSYFVNIANLTLAQQPHTGNNLTRTVNCPKLVFHPTNALEVKQVIQTIRPKTSAGIDDFSPKALKLCEEELVFPLVDVVNRSFSQGLFPDQLKISKVTPLHKQGDVKIPNNYRPISLLPTISKVIEKIALNRLIRHIKSNHLLTTDQHGFISGRSTTTAIISLIEQIIDEIENGKTVTSIFLDYSKAFDCLSHDLLIDKLKGMGVRDTESRWFKSYLENRKQVVEILSEDKGVRRRYRSELENITRGVPQGSILGPVLFIIFTSDMPDFLHPYCATLMYADDTVLIRGKKTTQELEVDAYIALNMALDYCHSNDLAVNGKKSYQLIFGNKRETTTAVPDITRAEVVKYLGITIDTDLSWSAQVDNVCGKLSSGIYVLKRLKSITDNKTVIRTAYFALVESHLRYGLVVWGNSSKTNLQRVLIHQKRVIRAMADLKPRDSCREVFKQLKILTIVSLYVLETVLYVDQLNLTRGVDLHDYNTRGSKNYALSPHRLTMYEKKPSYIGARFSNILPQELKLARTFKQKKQQITNWLENHPFYTVEEFINWKNLPI